MAHKHLLQDQKLQSVADQRLLQGQLTMLEDDLRQRKTEFEEKNQRVQTELKEALAEQ